MATIAEDLALDEALLLEAEAGLGGVLRLWEPARYAVVLGASGRWRDEVRADACRADGVDLARRSSGGGTVVVGPGALNVAVVLPVAASPEYRAVDTAQRSVLARLAATIRESFGVPAEVLGSGDLTLGIHKFSGSAQRRLRNHFLVHATVLYDFPLDRIARYLATPGRQPSYREGRPHEDFVTNLGLPRSAVAEAARRAFLQERGTVVEAAVPTETIARLVAERFGERAWIERF